MWLSKAPTATAWRRGLFVAWSCCISPVSPALAQSEEAPAEETDLPDDDDIPVNDDPLDVKSPYVWGGIGIPLVNFNTVDGLGFGLGGQVFDRKRGTSFGYRYRATLSTFWTVSGNYTSNYLQVERRSKHTWLTRITHQRWRDMIYVGSGGANVSVRDSDDSGGNFLESVTGFGNVLRRVRGTPLSMYAQVYGRWARAEPRLDGRLSEDSPLGSSGGFYFDLGGGAFVNEVDRWPIPVKGIQSELAFRVGGTASPDGFDPLVGVRGELMGWWPVYGDRLVISSRSVLDKTFGRRPFFEQEFLSGQGRDELAYDQILTGYGRTRTRGDGVFASLIQVRSQLGHARKGFFDLALYLAAYAEVGWLFKGHDPGPPMPTVGVSPLLLWQGGVVLRPFLSWGWYSDTPGGKRTPDLVFGVSLMSTM